MRGYYNIREMFIMTISNVNVLCSFTEEEYDNAIFDALDKYLDDNYTMTNSLKDAISESYLPYFKHYITCDYENIYIETNRMIDPDEAIDILYKNISKLVERTFKNAYVNFDEYDEDDIQVDDIHTEHNDYYLYQDKNLLIVLEKYCTTVEYFLD